MPENDLLQNPAFRAPGLGERLRELFLGEKRPLDCVQVEVTSCCAGRCVYCPHTTQTGSWRSRHMPDEVFAALVGDLGVCALFGVAAVLVGLALGRDSVTGQRDSIAG